MEFIFGLLFFSLAAYISFYLPGKLILCRIFPDLNAENTSLISWPIGILLFLFGSYIGAWIHFPYLYLVVIAGIFFYVVSRQREMFRINFPAQELWSWGIIVLGSLIFLSLTAFSYFPTKSGIQFIGTINIEDGLLHIGYTKNLLTTFPPNHAGLANVPLRGYHYFYDLLISRLVMFYRLRPVDLYYRYLPLFISLIYGLGFWFVSGLVSQKKLSQRLVLFFAYFAQSFALILSFFIQSISPAAELGSIYPLELILNPAIVLSIGILLCVMYLFLVSKSKAPQMVLIGFLLGMIVELKVYTGIIGISVFAFILLLRIIKTRKHLATYFLGFLTTVIVAAITYIPNNLGAGSLLYSPFFAYSVFMQEQLFTSWHWELKRIIFSSHHNFPRLILLYIQAIGLFWILSLGSRLVMLIGVGNLLKKEFWKKESNLVLGAMIVVPIVIGSLFVQSVSIFDTKQFFWIAGALIAIPVGVVIGNLLTNKPRVLQIMIILLLVILSSGGIVVQINNFLIHPTNSVIPLSDITFLQKVGSVVPRNTFILYIKEYNEAVSITQGVFPNSPVVAAITGRSTYYEPESAQFALDNIFKERQTNLLVLDGLLHEQCNAKQITSLIRRTGSPYIVITHPNKCLAKLSSTSFATASGLTYYKVKL